MSDRAKTLAQVRDQHLHDGTLEGVLVKWLSVQCHLNHAFAPGDQLLDFTKRRVASVLCIVANLHTPPLLLRIDLMSSRLAR